MRGKGAPSRAACYKKYKNTNNLPGWEQIFLGGPPKQILCMGNTVVASPSSLKLVTAPLFNITFFYFLMCPFFRHPASRWLRYTGCLLSFRLKESLSPPDLVSLWRVEQRGKNECRTNKWRWRKNRPPVYEIQGRIRSEWIEKLFLAKSAC